MALLDVQQHGRIAILTFNRPESRNPLGSDGDGPEIAAACARINADPNTRCVILTGAGPAFSAGGDLKAMQQRTGTFAGSAVQLRENYRNNIHKLIRAIYCLEAPSIAAVNGPAIGLGCDVACAADIRVASHTAKFGVTFLKVGLVPGDGGAWLLPRIIGMSRACELLFTGDVIDADTAQRWGLVSQVVGSDELLNEALNLAHRIAQQPSHALRLSKHLLKQGQSTSYDTLMEMSAAVQAISHLTDEHAEGVAALLEKRTPKFSV
jgi:enoyl-CoA hydratase/carnithine racemase